MTKLEISKLWPKVPLFVKVGGPLGGKWNLIVRSTTDEVDDVITYGSDDFRDI